MLVLDLPSPAGIHRLRGGVRQNRLVGLAVPAADDGAIAEERAVEADERFFERLAEEFAAKAARVDEEVGGDPAPVFQMHRGDAPLGQPLAARYFAIDELNAVLARDKFEDIDKLFVFDVKGVPALDVRTT